MTSRQLEIFLRLSRNLNFAKTASEMYMTQSTISREIQLLEKELGFSLFDRNPKYVKLTSKGKQLCISLLPLLNSIKNTLSNIQQTKSCYNSCLRIGFYHRASILKIPEVLKEFHHLYPNVQPELHQGNLNQLNTLFASEHLDVIFGMKNAFPPCKNSQIQELYKGFFCVSVPIDHPLACLLYTSDHQRCGCKTADQHLTFRSDIPEAHLKRRSKADTDTQKRKHIAHRNPDTSLTSKRTVKDRLIYIDRIHAHKQIDNACACDQGQEDRRHIDHYPLTNPYRFSF